MIKKLRNLLADREAAIAEVTRLLQSANGSPESIVDAVDKHLGYPARLMLEEATGRYYDHADLVGVPDSWYLDACPYLGHSVSTSFFDCPTCGAEPGTPCLKENGTRAKKNHTARQDAADQHLSRLRQYALRKDIPEE